MSNKEIRREVEEHLVSMESQLDTVYNAPVTDGGMEYLMEHQDEITFCEDEIEGGLDILDCLDEDDKILKEFFGKKPFGQSILGDSTPSIL